MSSPTSPPNDRSEYFYDLLDQLLVIGRQAGGEAMIDAILIGGLIATRKTQARADQPTDEQRSA